MSNQINDVVSKVLHQLRDAHQTVSVAESLTGGLLASAITEIPGASDVFLGGVVAYDARLKSELLGVDSALIAQHGVVSREVATAMASGIASRTRSDWAIATTGVAGPGASAGIPAGQVWISIARSNPARAPYAELLSLTGGRQEVRLATIARALEAFTRILSE